MCEGHVALAVLLSSALQSRKAITAYLVHVSNFGSVYDIANNHDLNRYHGYEAHNEFFFQIYNLLGLIDW